jgi:V-type H+-transporting ATPase proteolipid subunit
VRLLQDIGAAYGTAKSGIGIAGVGTFRPDLIMKVNLSSLAVF